jgi:hypothetical protein
MHLNREREKTMADLDYPPMISIHLVMPEFSDSDDLTISASKKWPPRISCIDLVTAPIIIDSPHEMPMLDYFVTEQYVRFMGIVESTDAITDALGGGRRAEGSLSSPL